MGWGTNFEGTWLEITKWMGWDIVRKGHGSKLVKRDVVRNSGTWFENLKTGQGSKKIILKTIGVPHERMTTVSMNALYAQMAY